MAQLVRKKFKVGERVRYVDRGDKSRVAAHIRFSPDTTEDVCIEFDTGELLVTTERNLVVDYLYNKNGVKLSNGEEAILFNSTNYNYSPLYINGNNIVVIEDSMEDDANYYGDIAVVRPYFNKDKCDLSNVNVDDLYPISKYAELLMSYNAEKLIKFIQKCIVDGGPSIEYISNNLSKIKKEDKE